MLKQLTERVFYMPEENETDRPLLGLIVGSRFSIMIDAGTSPKHVQEFMAEVEKLGVPPIAYVLITHWHWDHVFGLETVGRTAVAHLRTKTLVDELRGRDWTDEGMERQVAKQDLSRFSADCLKVEMPKENDRVIGKIDLTFDHRMEFDLGDTACEIVHVGGGHTEDSSVVFFPEDRVLFLGDCLYGRRYEGVYGYRMDSLSALIETLRGFDADYFLDSHGGLLTRQDMEALFEKMISLGKMVGERHQVEACMKSYEEVYGRKPDEESAFFLRCFAEVNQVFKKQQI